MPDWFAGKLIVAMVYGSGCVVDEVMALARDQAWRRTKDQDSDLPAFLLGHSGRFDIQGKHRHPTPNPAPLFSPQQHAR
jgi:hypothetical protein